MDTRLSKGNQTSTIPSTTETAELFAGSVEGALRAGERAADEVKTALGAGR